MSVSDKELLRIGRLARITIEGADLPRLTADCNGILGYVKKLEEVNVSQVEAMSHVHGISNVLREDVPNTPIPAEQLLKGVPRVQENFIAVPLVIEQE